MLCTPIEQEVLLQHGLAVDLRQLGVDANTTHYYFHHNSTEAKARTHCTDVK